MTSNAPSVDAVKQEQQESEALHNVSNTEQPKAEGTDSSSPPMEGEYFTMELHYSKL